MIVASLLNQTRALFPNFSEDDIEVTPLEKGGSDRKFYRVETGMQNSIILIKYNEQKEENCHYVTLAEFLGERGINVPRIFHHDAVEGLIWMQDLGENDLWAHRLEPWEMRRPLYEWTIEQAARLHALPLEEAEDLQLQPGFDERLYRWEQSYFFENCLGRHFRKETVLADSDLFSSLAHRLAELPRVLVHRDFQSQNIMLNEADAWLIDFQGMRPGLRQYDLASLLYDPYVELNAGERGELLEYYQTAAGIKEPDFLEIFRLCAVQRLMQALGAYGFLGHVKEKPEFLRHIPKALASLREVVADLPDLAEFGKLLAELE